MKLMTNPGGVNTKRPGVMIPTPQYPLYRAFISGPLIHMNLRDQ